MLHGQASRSARQTQTARLLQLFDDVGDAVGVEVLVGLRGVGDAEVVQGDGHAMVEARSSRRDGIVVRKLVRRAL